jgi:hypothetical protein
VGLPYRSAGAGCEPPLDLSAANCGEIEANEALLRRLLGNTESAADLRPRAPRISSLSDEVFDKVVSDGGEVARHFHGRRQAHERGVIAGLLGDLLHQVCQPAFTLPRHASKDALAALRASSGA